MNSKLKFGLITMIIVGTLTWLGVSGVNETATYYVTVDELRSMDDALEKRLRVGGDVEPNSIVRDSEKVVFTITQGDEKLQVVYTGRDPLPDTFRDRAQALCDGRLRSDGVFEAKKIQAKCASKYEVDPTKGVQPVYQAEPENTASL
jgi:cytochrome c-type biogenesis protein CcmE